MDEHALERELEQQQRMLDATLDDHARRARLTPTGRCLYCDDPVPEGAMFCPPEPGGLGCRDDYEALESAGRRNGIA